MTDPVLFKIPMGEVGGFGLELVDRDAIGYSDTWQAPDGKELPLVTQADYDSGSTSWQCQLTSAALVATPNVTTNERAGTFCAPPGQSIVVGEDSFTLDISAFQDANAAAGLARYLYANRTKEAYFYFSADGPDGAPRAIGRCRLVSGPIGGDTYTDLTADISLPVTKAPDIEFGTGLTTDIVKGDGSTPVGP